MEEIIINAIKNYGMKKAMSMFAKEDFDDALGEMTGGGIKGNSFTNMFTGEQGVKGLFKNQAKKFGMQQLPKIMSSGALLPFGAIAGLAYLNNKYNPPTGLQNTYGLSNVSKMGDPYGYYGALQSGNLDQDPFGINTNSAFGNYGEYASKTYNKLSEKERSGNDLSKFEKAQKEHYNNVRMNIQEYGRANPGWDPSLSDKENKSNAAADKNMKEAAAITKSIATPTTQRGPNEGGGGGGKQSPGAPGAPSHSTRDLMAKGGDVLSRRTGLNDEARKESQVKQFTPPPEETGILQKLFGIDTDKLYDQGFDSMNKYRERNPDNPREVLQTAGGKLSNLRHGVSTSLLRDAILKKINPGSYEMKEAPPSMNFKELKMSEEGPNKAAKGVASLLAYLGAGSNEIGTDFFSQETMEDLTANLLGLMKTDVYDTPEDKAAMLNEILENDTGGINTYLQSLAPKEKYQEDASLFPPMRQDKMRDQDLLFMKAEEEYEDKVKNLGLGDMDG